MKYDPSNDWDSFQLLLSGLLRREGDSYTNTQRKIRYTEQNRLSTFLA